MYGLTMLKDYLNEIIDGTKTFDARSYPTNKRGTIALVDSRSMKVYGTVELIGCREISSEEYCSWHATGKWAGMIFEAKDKNAKFYAYDFSNPQRLVKPIKVNVEKHMWIFIDEPIEKEFNYIQSLF